MTKVMHSASARLDLLILNLSVSFVTYLPYFLFTTAPFMFILLEVGWPSRQSCRSTKCISALLKFESIALLLPLVSRIPQVCVGRFLVLLRFRKDSAAM